jgi:hypothetical protein
MITFNEIRRARFRKLIILLVVTSLRTPLLAPAFGSNSSLLLSVLVLNMPEGGRQEITL